MFEGLGTFTWPSRKQTYEGNWKEGKMHGRGKLSFENGDFFQGEFKNGERNGTGILYLKSGKRVTGTWAEDKLVVLN